MIATIILGVETPTFEVEGDLIGVDRGAYYCAIRKLPMRFAIGDFDSLTLEELDVVREWSQELIYFDSIKDETDSEATVRLLYERGYQKFNLIGGLGKRMDHSWINLQLVKQYPNVTLLDSYNKIYCLSIGKHQIPKTYYSYFSLFALEESEIELSGVKYPISKRMLTPAELYTSSNEINDIAELIIYSGKLLIMETKD